MKNLSNSQNYQNAQVYSEKLPKGAYLIKILDVKEQDNSAKGYNNQLIFRFDIAEGEYKDFFKKNYESQTQEDKKWKGTYRIYEPADDGTEKDNWTMSKFKTMTNNFEDSNEGYHWNWDEQTLKNKLIGAIFNEKEYDFNGHHGFFTNCHSFIAKSKIENARIPEPTLLRGSTASVQPVGDGFVNVPDGVEEEIPFE